MYELCIQQLYNCIYITNHNGHNDVRGGGGGGHDHDNGRGDGGHGGHGDSGHGH